MLWYNIVGAAIIRDGLSGTSGWFSFHVYYNSRGALIC